MTVKIQNVNILTEDGDFILGSLVYDETEGRILKVGDCSEERTDAVRDGRGCLLLPGMIDIHTHGRAGADFISASVQDMRRMARSYLCSGVTSLLPTLASAQPSELCCAGDRIREASDGTGGARFIGTHLEGRYLAKNRRGAHNESLLALPDAKELEEIIPHLLPHIHISAAYELAGGMEFAACARRHGATLSLGHTDATYAQARQCEEMGVASYTHLANAMPTIHHREGGAVTAALTGKAYCEIICDGIHLCPEFVELVYKCRGIDGIILVSDSMSATDCPDGEYSIAGMPVTVKDGIARTHDGALAGSTLSLMQAVKNLSRFCDIPFGKAYLAASKNPARLIGLSKDLGIIKEGACADMLLLDPSTYEINEIYVAGQRMDIALA